MFWVVDSLMMRKYKTMKSLDDSCDSSVKKADSLPWGNSEESRVRRTDVCTGRAERIEIW